MNTRINWADKSYGKYLHDNVIPDGERRSLPNAVAVLGINGDVRQDALVAERSCEAGVERVLDVLGVAGGRHADSPVQDVSVNQPRVLCPLRTLTRHIQSCKILRLFHFLTPRVIYRCS
jgi:hypothetical protein